MAPFEELQDLWQRQAEIPTTRLEDVNRLLRAYGRRQNWINTAKAVVVGALLAACIVKAHSSPIRLAALIVIVLAAAAVMAREWRAQSAIARRDFSEPSLGFVTRTLDRLLEQ